MYEPFLFIPSIIHYPHFRRVKILTNLPTRPSPQICRLRIFGIVLEYNIRNRFYSIILNLLLVDLVQKVIWLFSLADGSSIAALLQIATDSDLTFTFNSRRSGEYCFESNKKEKLVSLNFWMFILHFPMGVHIAFSRTEFLSWSIPYTLSTPCAILATAYDQDFPGNSPIFSRNFPGCIHDPTLFNFLERPWIQISQIDHTFFNAGVFVMICNYITYIWIFFMGWR